MDDAPARTSWLPGGFQHPVRVELPTGHYLRPIRADDVELDYPAVMRSRERLWSIYGEAWGWPPAAMTVEQDRDDLARHEAEIEAHDSFNYALFDSAETALLGCVYIDPTDTEAPTPRCRGGSWTTWWGPRSRRRSKRWCRPGSPRTGRSDDPSWSAARCHGLSGSHGPQEKAAAEVWYRAQRAPRSSQSF